MTDEVSTKLSAARASIDWEAAALLPDNTVEILRELEAAFIRHNIPLENVHYRIALPSETVSGKFMLHLYSLKAEPEGQGND